MKGRYEGLELRDAQRLRPLENEDSRLESCGRSQFGQGDAEGGDRKNGACELPFSSRAGSQNSSLEMTDVSR